MMTWVIAPAWNCEMTTPKPMLSIISPTAIMLTVIMTDDSDAEHYYAHDHIFSVVALIEDDGDVEERYEYDAYGKPTISNAGFTQTYDTSQFGNPYMFTSRRVDSLDTDDLQLQYNRNRYYDYHTGRWLTHDPLGYVDGMNLYQYVNSNPITNFDPYGLYLPPYGPDASTGVIHGISPTEKAIQSLQSIDNHHKDRLYYGHSGIGPMIQRLIQVVRKVGASHHDILLMIHRNQAEYHPGHNQLWIRTSSNPGDVLHESVHALDDQEDWYIKFPGYDEEAAEALAYGTEALQLQYSGSFFEEIEKNVTTAQGALVNWRNSWLRINSIIDQTTLEWREWEGCAGPYAKYLRYVTKQRTITNADMEDIKNKLGFKAECLKLKGIYENHLRSKNICVTLPCKGFEDFELHPVFLGEED